MPRQAKAGVTPIYRMWVDLPDDLSDWIKASPERVARWEAAVAKATPNHDHAGSDSYSEHTEWAEFSTYQRADRARKLMLILIVEWQTAMQEGWPAHERTEP